MKLWSDSWTSGDRIPSRYAAGKPDGAGGAGFSDNISPHLAWSDLPPGTQSLVLICHDTLMCPAEVKTSTSPAARCLPIWPGWISFIGC
jgi:hypothetical protein